MGGRESSRVNAMIYNYIIIDNKVVELEGPKKVRFDRPGTNIDVIVKNKNRAESFPDMFKRKLKWLSKDYPELLI